MSYFETNAEFLSSSNDELCDRAAEQVENVQNQIQQRNESGVRGIQSVRDIRNTEKPLQQNISAGAKGRIKTICRTKVLAYPYLIDQFFSFEKWPNYMVELFVLNNVAMYTYTMRNKICLFFFGNGAKIDVMFTLSEFFAPPMTAIQQRDYNQSYRKCIGLFRTYAEQRTNPAYSQRYYYYNMIERRMLFLDGVPRHYGQRQ